MFTAAANDDDAFNPKPKPGQEPKMQTEREAIKAYRDKIVEMYDELREKLKRPTVRTRTLKKLFR